MKDAIWMVLSVLGEKHFLYSVGFLPMSTSSFFDLPCVWHNVWWWCGHGCREDETERRHKRKRKAKKKFVGISWLCADINVCEKPLAFALVTLAVLGPLRGYLRVLFVYGCECKNTSRKVNRELCMCMFVGEGISSRVECVLPPQLHVLFHYVTLGCAAARNAGLERH